MCSSYHLRQSYPSQAQLRRFLPATTLQPTKLHNHTFFLIIMHFYQFPGGKKTCFLSFHFDRITCDLLLCLLLESDSHGLTSFIHLCNFQFSSICFWNSLLFSFSCALLFLQELARQQQSSGDQTEGCVRNKRFSEKTLTFLRLRVRRFFFPQKIAIFPINQTKIFDWFFLLFLYSN